jgi:hypothetical protein
MLLNPLDEAVALFRDGRNLGYLRYDAGKFRVANMKFTDAYYHWFCDKTEYGKKARVAERLLKDLDEKGFNGYVSFGSFSEELEKGGYRVHLPQEGPRMSVILPLDISGVGKDPHTISLKPGRNLNWVDGHMELKDKIGPGDCVILHPRFGENLCQKRYRQLLLAATMTNPSDLERLTYSIINLGSKLDAIEQKAHEYLIDDPNTYLQKMGPYVHDEIISGKFHKQLPDTSFV